MYFADRPYNVIKLRFNGYYTKNTIDWLQLFGNVTGFRIFE